MDPCGSESVLALPAGGPLGGESYAESETRKLMSLLKPPERTRASPSNFVETTLEYRGQWQPRPNGAETGHGVVPKEWAIEVASENDRALAGFGWAGGAQLCLSNAFRQVGEIEAQAQDLLDSGICTESDAVVQCIRTIAKSVEEREALMRRQWCDIDFQQGASANQDLVRHLERDFASQLVRIVVRQQQEDEAARETKEGGLRGCGRWSNVKLVGNGRTGRTYLGARIGGEVVELSGCDDESGRQRWRIEVIEPPTPSFASCDASDSVGNGEVGFTRSETSCHLRLLGGVPQNCRLLGRRDPFLVPHSSRGDLELCECDDGSGRQRWRLVERKLARTVGGDEGIYVEILTGGDADGQPAQLLGATMEGDLGLYYQDDSSSQLTWFVSGWLRLPFSGRSTKAEDVITGPPTSVNSESDEIVSLWDSTGVNLDVSLSDLSRERMTRALSQSRNLGTAIDLVGVYLKNYEIDKADRLCRRIEPICRERGGLWLFKMLNFYTTVRMKQSRYDEALALYREYEELVKFSPDQAWELYDTIYRNFGWIYTSLGNFEKALEYFEKAVDIKRMKGVEIHWFDQWDLGKTHARLSLQCRRPEILNLAFELIKKGLDSHRQAEPDDVIMRCKILNSAGECASVLGDLCTDGADRQVAWYDEAIAFHLEAYQAYMKVLGPMKPLTGWCMEDLAGAYKRRGRHESAKELLHGAFEVECSKDIIKLPSVARLLDSIVEVHCITNDSDGLARCQDAINIGLRNLQRRGVDIEERPSYAALLQKIADVLLMHSLENLEGAAGLLQEGIQYLSGYSEPAGRNGGDHGNTRFVSAFSHVEERERFEIPRAGQQELGVDATRLLASLRYQLECVRLYPSKGPLRPAWCEDANHRRALQSPSATEDEVSLKSATLCANRCSLSYHVPEGCPVFFEVIDDFQLVD